jgi:intracellular sulfur oxidation DsrE/DsrF family protein
MRRMTLASNEEHRCGPGSFMPPDAPGAPDPDRRGLIALGAGLAAVAGWPLAAAAAPPSAASAPLRSTAPDDVLPDRPFAEHRVVLQLSDRDPAKHALVLSVAYNLLKAYGPDRVSIEVVAFGPGIDLLRAESPNRVRVDSLVAQEVRFSVCMNTIETIERESGARVALNPNAIKVQTGVARILVLSEAGYTLVRP